MAEVNIGMPFADISNPENMTKQDWDHSAPKWRIASPGLTLEGTCTNSSCEASNMTVVYNWGITTDVGVFNLIEHAPKIACPVCKQRVTPKTCAFNNCDWKYTGRQFTFERGGFKVGEQNKWYTADNHYWIFDKDIVANWLDLMISTRKIGDNRSYTGSA